MNRDKQYKLQRGKMVKGYPYLQTEMPQPPADSPSFSSITGDLWGYLNGADVYHYLVNILLSRMRTRVLSWLGWRNTHEEILTPNGSSIIITENSIPADADSILFRHWDWGDQPDQNTYSTSGRQVVHAYNQRLRTLREENLGLHYGIGGFYKFECNVSQWSEAPLLTIRYDDNEIDPLLKDHLAIYWEDADGLWQILPSVSVADSNVVRAYIPFFSTYTLAPRLPGGGLSLSSDPTMLIADGLSTAIIESELLYNNDGSMVNDGTAYTISVNRGQILTPDGEPSKPGHQIHALSGTISFVVQSGLVPLPIDIQVVSMHGFSSGSYVLPLYSSSNVIEPAITSCMPEHRALRITWESQNDPAIVGYKIYYDTDSTGAPYNGTSSVIGSNSPVLVGNVNQYTLGGLSNSEQYYVTLTSIDAFGNESPYSNEIVAQPLLQAVANLMIERHNVGFQLYWQRSFGATSYKIYRGTDPNQAVSSMEYLGQTINNNYFDNQYNDKNFYRVIAVGH